MSFEARHIPIQPNDGVTDWRAWGAAVMDQIKAATTSGELSAIVDLNQEAFAECAEKAPKAYQSLSDALERRRRQIQAGA